MLSAKRKELQQKLDNANVTTLPAAVQKDIDFGKLVDLLQSDNEDYITKGNALRSIFEYFIWDKKNNEMRSVLDVHIKSSKQP